MGCLMTSQRLGYSFFLLNFLAYRQNSQGLHVCSLCLGKEWNAPRETNPFMSFAIYMLTHRAAYLQYNS